MNQENVNSAIVYPVPPPLLPPTLQVIPTEIEIEHHLQILISEHRKASSV